jgi:hypothetical protein
MFGFIAPATATPGHFHCPRGRAIVGDLRLEWSWMLVPVPVPEWKHHWRLTWVKSIRQKPWFHGFSR